MGLDRTAGRVPHHEEIAKSHHRYVPEEAQQPRTNEVHASKDVLRLGRLKVWRPGRRPQGFYTTREKREDRGRLHDPVNRWRLLDFVQPTVNRVHLVIVRDASPVFTVLVWRKVAPRREEVFAPQPLRAAFVADEPVPASDVQVTVVFAAGRAATEEGRVVTRDESNPSLSIV